MVSTGSAIVPSVDFGVRLNPSIAIPRSGSKPRAVDLHVEIAIVIREPHFDLPADLIIQLKVQITARASALKTTSSRLHFNSDQQKLIR